MNTTVSKNTVKVYTTLDKTFVEALCGTFTDSQPKEKRIVFEVLNQEKEMLQADCIIGEATLLQQRQRKVPCKRFLRNMRICFRQS